MLDPNDPRLTAYVMGELEAGENKLVEDELSASPELRREVEAIRYTVMLLGDGLGSEPCPELAASQKAAIQRESVRRVEPLRRQTAVWGLRLAVAASILFVVGGFLVLPQLQTVRDTALRVASEEPMVEESTQSNEGTGPTGKSRGEKLSVAPMDGDAGSVGSYSAFADSSEEGEPQPQNGQSRERRFAGVDRDASGSGAMPALNDSESSDYVRVFEDESGAATSPATAPASPAQESPAQESPAPAPASGMRRGLGGGSGESGGFGGGRVAGGAMGDRPAGGNFGFRGEPADAFDVNEHFDDRSQWFGRSDDLSEEELEDELQAAPSAAELAGEVRLQDGTVDPRSLGRALRESALDGQPQEPSGLSAAHRSDGARPQSESIRDDREELSEERREPERIAGQALAEDLTQLGQAAAKRPAKKEDLTRLNSRRTWIRSRATPNASQLMIGDRDELPLEGMQVNVAVDGFRARVLLDLYFFNDRGRQLEGNFKLRLPNDASLYYFAFGQSSFEYRPTVDQLASKGFLSADVVRAAGLTPEGILRAREGSWSNVKEARVVQRDKAAHAYGETVRRRVDPALVEWSGAGVFNARVFPLMPNKLHRVVVGYDVTLQQEGADQVYRLDLPEGHAECMVDINVTALPGSKVEVTPAARPFTSGGRAYYHFKNPVERSLSVHFEDPSVVLLAGKDESAGEFFATKLTPDLPADATQASASDAVFLVDTSLSSRPDRMNVWLDLLEEILSANRDSLKRFAVVFFNIEPHWWKEEFVENTPENVDALMAYGHSLSLEGATDLRQALSRAASPDWNQGNVGAHDVFLLSDGAVTWGEMDLHHLSSAMQGGTTGSLFAYQTGMTGTATNTLEHLTRETGGAVFSVINEQEVEVAATAHRQRPWQLLEVTVSGGTDVLVAGRPKYIYPGQSLVVVGRGKPEPTLALQVRRADERRTLDVAVSEVIESELAPRLYGEVAVGQLEDLGGDIEDVAVAYARHFRVTGRTCSLLMLESDADYQRFNIKPEDDSFVVRSSPSARLIVSKLDELASELGNAKVALTRWIEKLENTPGFQFAVPTSLRLVIERLPEDVFDVAPGRLVCRRRSPADAPKEYFQQLDKHQLDYVSVSEQAAKEVADLSAADALRTLSSLIEENPGDPVLTRDVAFSAIEWGMPGQAYPLLKRVASMRPYEPQTYQAMAQCLAETGHSDLAMIYYEIVMNGRWHQRYQDVHQIVGTEYLHLLQRITRRELESSAPDYVQARLASLSQQVPAGRADVVVTMMWNTDRTDVDLHVLEPTGEECYYKHPRTRIGGRVTADVTEGYGPEMYTLVDARNGKYQVMANYFGSDANRTQVRTKVYVTVYKNFGDEKRETIEKRTVTLSNAKEKRDLATIRVEK